MYYLDTTTRKVTTYNRLPEHVCFSRTTRHVLDSVRSELAGLDQPVFLLFTVYNHTELDMGVSGKVKYGETIDRAINREAVEEIGCFTNRDVPHKELYSGKEHTIIFMSTYGLLPASKRDVTRWERNDRYYTRRDTRYRVTLVTFTHDPVQELARLKRGCIPSTRPHQEQIDLTGWCLVDVQLCSDQVVQTRELKGSLQCNDVYVSSSRNEHVPRKNPGSQIPVS
jgi:8-oxo-dGTP pyrophosphatase MutT (NUDIX family)